MSNFISRFNPIQEQLIWQFPSILFGTLFIFMARLIRRRVKGAFIASLITFVLTLIYVNLNGISWAMSFLMYTLFGAYVDHQKEVVIIVTLFIVGKTNQGFPFPSLYYSGSSCSGWQRFLVSFIAT